MRMRHTMNNDVVKAIPTDVSTPEGSEVLALSDRELLIAGCKNCVWKLADQCPRNLGPDEVLPDGICKDMTDFIFGLANPGDSSSMVWEKFHIYKAQIQEAEDYKDYLVLKENIGRLEGVQSKTPEEKERLDQLRMQRGSAKIWWSRLNELIIKSRQKVADREQKAKSDNPHKNKGIYSAKTINFNVAPKEVEDNSKLHPDT